MKNLFRFFVSKAFLINLGVAIVVVVAVIWGSLKFLDIYTQHGETVTVPNFVGYETNKLDQFIEGKEVQYVIIDSVFDLEQPRGTVLDQKPQPEMQVKKGRKIYLTVNAQNPAMVPLPNIKDVSKRQAISLLETYAIKVEDLRYTPDLCVNCVLAVQHKGKNLETGDMIEKGSKVVLVLGSGEGRELVPVPFLNGLTLPEAEALLLEKSLNTGAILCDGCETKEDSAMAKVYKQNPPYYRDAMINMGKTVDLYLRIGEPDSTATEGTE